MRCLATLTLVLALASAAATGDGIPPPGSAGTLNAKSRDNAFCAKTAMQSEESELPVSDVSDTTKHHMLDLRDMLTILAKAQAALPDMKAHNIDGQTHSKEEQDGLRSAFNTFLYASLSPDSSCFSELSNSTQSASSQVSAEASPKPGGELPNPNAPPVSGRFMVFNGFPVDLGAACELHRRSGAQPLVRFMTFNGFPVDLGASPGRQSDSGAESASQVIQTSNEALDKRQ